MARLTFTRHTIQANDVRPGIIETPVTPRITDSDTTIRSAGFDPKDNLVIGVLASSWKGHPQYAVFILDDFNMVTGSTIAVSNETLDEVDPIN